MERFAQIGIVCLIFSLSFEVFLADLNAGGNQQCDPKCIHPNVTNGEVEITLDAGTTQAPPPGDYGDYDPDTAQPAADTTFDSVYGNYDYDTSGNAIVRLNTRMNVRCNPGYLYNGTDLSTGVITCVRRSTSGGCDAGWSADTSSICSPVTCDPKTQKNAKVTNTCHDDTALNDPVPRPKTACVRCESGYRMLDANGDEIASTVITCQINGQWNVTVRCTNAIACPSLQAPRFGSISSFNNLTFAVFRCQDRFLMYGRRVLRCDLGQWIDSPPLCRYKASCLTDTLSNGTIIVDPSAKRAGPWVRNQISGNYTCASGLIPLTDTTAIKCVGGEWDPKPRCVRENPCPDYPAIQNGTVSLSTSRILPGTVAKVTCRPGFLVDGSEIRTCQEDGSWSGTSASCLRKNKCATPPTVDKTYPPQDGDSYFEGDVARYRCKPGYESSGSPSRITCTRHGWEDVQFRCRAVSCGRPSNIRNTERIGDDFRFGSQVSYRCLPGYKMTGGILKTRICQPNKRWTVISMKCEEARCPSLHHIANGILQHLSGWAMAYGSIYQYICMEGYSFAGHDAGKTEVVLRCRGNQTWDRNLPLSCEKAYCPELSPIPHGTLDHMSGWALRYRSTYRYTCKRGYKFGGDDVDEPDVVLTCRADLTWDRAVPSCEIVKCPPIPVPENGKVTKAVNKPGDWEYGSEYLVGCTGHHKLKGKEPGETLLWVCQYDGTWSGKIGQCQARKIFLSRQVWAEFLGRTCCSPMRDFGYDWNSEICPVHWYGSNTNLLYECSQTCRREEVDEYYEYSSDERTQVWAALRGVKVPKFGNQCCWTDRWTKYQCFEYPSWLN